MESINSLLTYNTDTFNSWGIGSATLESTKSFEEVFNYAIKIKCNLIVKPSRGKYWYIKGINQNKSYEEIKNHIENNLKNGYKSNSKCWLINYN
jgi:hypothetical protein